MNPIQNSLDRIRVVELFAGVGGFRLGLEGWNGKSASSGYQSALHSEDGTGFDVVWSNQWEPSTKRQHANEVYMNRWPDAVHSEKDISLVATDEIPDHDLLVGGFPCQDYSVASTLKNAKGLRGKKGVLWWQIERILREKGENAPRFLFLENVDRLLKSPSSQRGRDFAIMLASLSDLGYAVEWRVLNAADYGMPQRRRRVFLVGYRDEYVDGGSTEKSSEGSSVIFEGVLGKAFPIHKDKTTKFHSGDLFGTLEELSTQFNADKRAALTPFLDSGFMRNRQYWTLDTSPDHRGRRSVLGDILQPLNEVDPSFFIDAGDVEKWEYLKGSKREPRQNKTLGYTYIFSEGALAFPDPLDKPSRTVITGEGGNSPSRTKHAVGQNGKLRRLTPIELERLNMFPDNHTELNGISDGRRAFFMGNALVVGVIERIGEVLKNRIQKEAFASNLVNHGGEI
jgi:DNA (cytosine-5)-methyltransferase 1